jgi:sortase A
MNDTTTLAKLSPPNADDSIADPAASAPLAAPGPQGTNGRAGIDIGAVAKRGIRVFTAGVLSFVVFAFALSGLAHARAQVGLQRRFRSELASNSAPVGGDIPIGAPVAMLQIPTIGITEAVVEGSRSGQLRSGPGHVLGTPLPGQPGNAVVAGRRAMYGGPFRRIGSLRSGDLIHITTGEGNATYRVVSVAKLAGNDGSFVQNHGDNRLTLFTAASAWNATGRLAVTAILRGNPYPPTAVTSTLDAAGLGLTGEHDAMPYMVLWLEALAGVGLLAAYFKSRWSTRRVWLVFTPLLAMTMWLFFESFIRLLPSTL